MGRASFEGGTSGASRERIVVDDGESFSIAITCEVVFARMRKLAVR